MTQAITTKHLAPTNHRGSRVKASAQAGSLTIGWDYAGNAEENHRAAALALAAKLGWGDDWAGGALPSGGGYAFVRVSD